jgi:hypothetical protein
MRQFEFENGKNQILPKQNRSFELSNHRNRFKTNYKNQKKEMKTIALIICNILFATTSIAQIKKNDTVINKVFPKLSAETLSKKAIEFPKDVKGKPTIIVIAFKREAQDQIDPWLAAISKKFKNKEINYYEIPMMSGGYKIISGIIDGGMRGGVPPALHDFVASYYGNLDNYISYLNIKKDKNCYLFLLDKNGIIKFKTESAINANKLQELEKNVAALLR